MKKLFIKPNYPVNFGLLLLRIGIGIAYIYHGFPKMAGGIERWTKIGESMSVVGIDFLPALWGFMASFTEFIGGILLILGLLFRPITILFTITMTIAMLTHISGGDGFIGYSHAMEMAILFFALIFIGPGKFSLDRI